MYRIDKTKIEKFIKQLPDRSPLLPSDLLQNESLIYRDQTLSIHYAPLDYLNRLARIAVIGISPGWQQMEIAYRVLRDGLKAGKRMGELELEAKTAASFAGPMRKNLVSMLDGLKLQEPLNLGSTTAVLFQEEHALLQTTSVVRYPTFCGDKCENYTGHRPKLLNHPILKQFVLEILAPELESIENALIVPLGKCVEKALEFLISGGHVSRDRCLLGFPHPSGLNGHRIPQYESARAALTDQVRSFFNTT